jgi:hypothetical protein
VNFDKIPYDLKICRQWCNWRYEEREGKKTKVPYNPQTGGGAMSNNPATWNAFTDCVSSYENGNKYDGVGFFLSPDDNFVGIDIDHCLINGELTEEAAEIVAAADSYTEVTPSGEGLRIFAKGILPEGRRKKANIEMYDRMRFLTVTGNVFAGGEIAERSMQITQIHAKYLGETQKPTPKDRMPRSVNEMPISDQAALSRMFAAKNGTRIGQLWRGDYFGAGYTSQSEADSALCYHLAFWLDADPERVDRMFRDSALYRDKWDEMRGTQTYGQLTVGRACGSVSEVYKQPFDAQSIQLGDPVPSDSIDSIVSIVNGTTNLKTDSPPPYKEEEDTSVNALRIRKSVDNVDNADFDAIVPIGDYELPTFPVHVLPLWLSDFVTGVSEQTQTPSDITAILSLTACAAAVAKVYEIQPKRGWREPLNLYTVSVLKAGHRKSSCVGAVLRPLEAWEKQERLRLEPEIAQAQSQKRVMEARLRDLENKAAKSQGEDGRYALMEAQEAAAAVSQMAERGEFRLFTEDCTPERLTGLMADNGGRLAVMSAEGDSFDIIGGRYSDKANLGVYLKSHNGETLLVDRIGRKSERVEKPALSLGLSVQPDVLRGLLVKAHLRGRGLLGRFLYSLPQDYMGFRNTDSEPLDEEFEARYCEGIHYLLSLKPAADDFPHTLKFSDAALLIFRQLEKDIEAQLRPGAEMGDMTDWGGKCVGAIARIAGVIHLASHAFPARPVTDSISAGDLMGAIAIGYYFIRHAQAAFAEMGADADLDNARHILEWVQRRREERFSHREIYRNMARRFKRSEDMAPALEILCARNYLREVKWESKGTKPKGSDFIVNPVVFDGKGKHGSL